MPKPASTPVRAIIFTLPVIVASALLGAPGARAATCTVDPTDCQPYVATIQQVGNTTVATGSGEFDLAGPYPPQANPSDPKEGSSDLGPRL